jgi:hypothetical protein
MSRLTAVVLSLAVLGSDWGTDRAAAATGDATEKLLKDAKLDYKKVKEGIFKLIVDGKQGVTVVILEEKKAPWKDSKGNEVLYVYMYCQVLATPKDFKPPTAMLGKLADWNDRIRFGSLGLSKNEDGTYSLYRNTTMFLKNADGEQMEDLVLILHSDNFTFQKEFRGFVKEE